MIRSLAFALLLAGCASAAPQECASPDWTWPNYRTLIEDQTPGLKWTELTSGERINALRNINSSPPITGWVYNRIGYFSSGSHSMVLMVFMMDDCVLENRMTPAGALRAMIGEEL